jgi:AmmeMemoRadiSam system protein A
MPLSAEHHDLLLLLARESIRAHLARELPPDPPALDVDGDYGGLFVTLYHAGRLRGCVGRLEMNGPLPAVVQNVALAVLRDARFAHQPVTAADLPRLTIEISLLSRLQHAADPLAFEPGVHGVYLRRGDRMGCFLPQVASKMHWGREEFLERCCVDKAGLPPDAWKDRDTEIYFFTTTTLREHAG